MRSTRLPGLPQGVGAARWPTPGCRDRRRCRAGCVWSGRRDSTRRRVCPRWRPARAGPGGRPCPPAGRVRSGSARVGGDAHAELAAVVDLLFERERRPDDAAVELGDRHPHGHVQRAPGRCRRRPTRGGTGWTTGPGRPAHPSVGERADRPRHRGRPCRRAAHGQDGRDQHVDAVAPAQLESGYRAVRLGPQRVAEHAQDIGAGGVEGGGQVLDEGGVARPPDGPGRRPRRPAAVRPSGRWCPPRRCRPSGSRPAARTRTRSAGRRRRRSADRLPCCAGRRPPGSAWAWAAIPAGTVDSDASSASGVASPPTATSALPRSRQRRRSSSNGASHEPRPPSSRTMTMSMPSRPGRGLFEAGRVGRPHRRGSRRGAGAGSTGRRAARCRHWSAEGSSQRAVLTQLAAGDGGLPP